MTPDARRATPRPPADDRLVPRDRFRGVLRGLRPGMREREAVALLGWNGMPLSCHTMLTAGPRATFGLPDASW